MKDQYSDKILKSIEILLQQYKSPNEYVEGFILTDNLNGTYDVKINNETYTIKSREGLTVNINEVYYIHILNNDFSKKYIYEHRNNIT